MRALPMAVGTIAGLFELRLGAGLRALLQRPFRFVDYSATVAPTTMPSSTK